MHKIVIAAAFLIALYPATVAAQTCHGTAALGDDRPIIVGGEWYHSDIVTGFGGNFVGGSSAMFGKVQVRRESYEGTLEGKTTVFGIGGGFQLAPDEERRLVICPELALTRHFSSETSTTPGTPNTGISAKAVGGGVSSGFVLTNGKVQIVPNAELWLSRFWPAGDSTADGATIGLVKVGTGIVISRRVSILPGVGFPFRSPGSSRYFVIGLSFSLGS